MFYNKMSRRYFLQGMGVNLMLPFLPSIMTNAYAATAGAPPLRYLQFLSAFGVYQGQFYPSDTGLVSQGDGIMMRPLSGITGNISPIVGPAFNNLKNNITLIRGLPVLAASNLHNGCLPTCASGTPEDNEANGRPVFPYSIDDVLAKSAKIYPNAPRPDIAGSPTRLHFFEIGRAHV